MAKQPRSRAKKLNLNVKDIWKRIVSDVEKQEVPIKVLDRLVIHLADGTNVEVNIKELIKDGADPLLIEEHLNQRLSDLSEIINDIDYYIDIDSVVKVVQPATDKILKDL
jgi:hypothetical protein